MHFSNSTSSIFAIGLFVFLQPITALAITHNAIVKPNSAKAITQPVANKVTATYTTQAISGLTKRIKLLALSELWTEFRQSSSITSQLSSNPSKVFVLYKNINADFTQATVTIGFDARDFTKPVEKISLPPASTLTLLLKKQKYTDSQLIQGWGKIDYTRPIESVVEINDLNSAAEPEATQLFVQYKQG